MIIPEQKERETQNRIVRLFEKELGYHYLDNNHDHYKGNIEEKTLRKFLEKKGWSTSLSERVIAELSRVSTNQTKSFYDVNRDVYQLLRYGIVIQEKTGEKNKTIPLIDWNNPQENRFGIAEEVHVKGQNPKRIDIVLYVNGIALSVLELKRSTISISEGIRQNLDNQSEKFIRPFFSTIQLIMAGNDSQGIQYGTIENPEKKHLTWSEESHVTNPLDRHIIQLCQKERLLELIHDFIAFDNGIKKICRTHQYFGIKAAQESLLKREGGIIWHTQGSGKSMVMVWLTKWIREHLNNSRVLIITDREELDAQIEGIYKGVSETIVRAKSGKDLIEKLNATTPLLLCSLIHKFGRKKKNEDQPDIDSYIEELKHSLPKNFRAKGEMIVFIDECHRTQSGKLHQAMKEILPNAIMIGFTGTPLLKADKQRSIEIFGKYIHTYKFDEAVKDKVILDLRYEARDIDQNISSQEKIDRWFEIKTAGLTPIAAARLKQKWGTMEKVLSSRSRLEKIVDDIRHDMGTKDRLMNGRGNALLVSGSIYEACKYYEIFKSRNFNKCAIITSYVPNISSIKGESTGEEIPTQELQKYNIYNEMLGGKTPEAFETEVKRQFIESPGQMQLLIVVDKLLTGFDAPSATYLYIDKSMQDHGLFQAICRVNRLDGDDKEYGYIIDYKDLFKSLEKSIMDYTSEAFETYEKKDIEGLLKNRLVMAREHLDEALETIRMLCEPVKPPKGTGEFIHYFVAINSANENEIKANEPKRKQLYILTSSLIRAYSAIANEMKTAGYTTHEIKKIREEVAFYEIRRKEIQIGSGDYIDLKKYEADMRHLIDTYIHAEESNKISAFDDMTLIELIVKKGKEAVDLLPEGIRKSKESTAEVIEGNIRRLITDETSTNPKYYERMSVLLEELIKQRKENAINYAAYLEKILELTKKVHNPGLDSSYPKRINTPSLRAWYDEVGGNEELAIRIDSEIRSIKKDDWKGDRIKEREVGYAIAKPFEDEIIDDDRLEKLLGIARDQKDY